MPGEFGNPLPWEPDYEDWLFLQMRALQNNLGNAGRIPAPNPQPQQTAPNSIPEEPVKVANSFLIGCDPEMVILKDGQIVNVNDKMPPFGEVGSDHGGNVVELRPQPAKSTFTLTKRLHTLLKEHPNLTQFESAKWRAGAFYESGGGLDGVEAAPGAQGTGRAIPPGGTIPVDMTQLEMLRRGAVVPTRPPRARVSLGGHIHLDIKRTGLEDNWYYDHEYVPALDRVTKYFEHLDLLPQKECLERRTRGGYGRYGDYRTEHGRMEYRTMASWLFSPKTTMLALTGAKLAAVDPALTLDTLKLKDISFSNLERFYESFPGDSDAKRVCEEILSKGLKDLQANPDQDVKGAWG